MAIVQDVPVSDIRVLDLSLGSIRAWSVYFIVSQNATVLKASSTERLRDLQSLRQSIIGLQELFSAHHSKIFLDLIVPIEEDLDAMGTNMGDMKVSQAYARKLMEWFGLIARYLLPHEGIGEVREGAVKFSVFADEVMLDKDQRYIDLLKKGEDQWITKQQYEKDDKDETKT